MKQYNKSNIPLAKALRKNMTPWERKLWYEFLRDYPVRFQRQKALDQYIVDFYCAKAGLVIELDGGGHYTQEQMQADTARTQILEKMNLTVLRICNLDIDRNFRGVCEAIDASVQQNLRPPLTRGLSAKLTGGETVSPSVTAGAVPPPSSEGGVKTIYALGFFDGVHLGHQALLKECRAMADRLGCPAAAITFSRHPQALFTDTPPGLINSLEDRTYLLKAFGMDAVKTYPVIPAVMGIPWEEFLEQLLEEGAAGFVCGSDFRFGHKGAGNAENLRAFCAEKDMPCVIVPEQTLEGIRISSTHIRNLLEAGEMEEACRFLGHPHILSGEVMSGRKLGRTLGIPTANLWIPEATAVPRHGVYACRAILENRSYLAVTNIGSRPTVGGHRVTVEPWLLDFSGDLYGKKLTLEFYAFLRPERKFAALEELREEIRKNAAQTLEFFENL